MVRRRGHGNITGSGPYVGSVHKPQGALVGLLVWAPIHRSAWKVYSPKPVCRILRSRGSEEGSEALHQVVLSCMLFSILRCWILMRRGAYTGAH